MTVSKRASKIYRKAKKVAKTAWNFKTEWAKAMRKAHKEVFAAASRISRKERAARFSKLYNAIVESVIKVGGAVNITEEITAETLHDFGLNIAKSYFLIMFREKAESDNRIKIEKIQKVGTICAAV